ncbi:MAG: hypothetical protein AB7S38_27160 [Vulcanimicrobiota bacterium]
MRIDTFQFQRAFCERARPLVPADQLEALPADSFEPSNQARRFQQMVLAVSAAAGASQVPALAALSQEIGQNLVSQAEDAAFADNLADQYSSLPHRQDPRVEQAWSQVAQASQSSFPAPVVLESSFIDAQSDSREMYLGTASLAGDMADDTILLFTLAHEEGHRQHRDKAGVAGLEAFLAGCQGNDQLESLSFKVLREGRHQNEREADAFAAGVLAQLGCDPAPALAFLGGLEADMQHPGGHEREQLVRQALGR